MVERVAAELECPWDNPMGQPRKLILREAVAAAAMYMRHNITEELLAAFMKTSQSTISRVLGRIIPALRAATEEFVPTPRDAEEHVAGTVVAVDGSQAPCWSWACHQELWSGKTGTTGHTFTVVSNLDGDVLYVSEPFSANTHDITVLRQTPTIDILAKAGGVIADLGYEGSGYTVPAKKPANGELLLREEEFNSSLSGLRAGVERAIANIKVWRILHTDYRRPIGTWKDSFKAVIGLYFFRLAYIDY